MSPPTSALPSESAFSALVLLGRHARILSVAALAGVLVGAVVAFALRPVYRAELKLVPADAEGDRSSLTQMLGRLGGIADLAGVDALGSGRKDVTLELLRSRSLARSFIESAAIAPQLDEKIGGRKGAAPAPLTFRALRRFDEKVRLVTEDKRSGIVTVAMYWDDPEVAARWANAYVNLFNAQMRQRAAADSKRNLQYLRQQLSGTNDVGVREAVYKLMEVELKTAMLADVREEYAAKVIDRAIAPDPADFARPKRALIMAGGLAAGLMLGMLWLLLRDVMRHVRAQQQGTP
jgi:uncharacterized protein involved in exopolysaccharide biosynthesis